MVALAALFHTGSIATAQQVGITADKAESRFTVNGREFTIARVQDTEHRLTGEFTRTSRECPPFCIQPITAADGVETLGELEVLDFLETEVSTGQGLLVDSRLPDWYALGTIPGAVNVPFPTLEADNPYRDDILQALGAVKRVDGSFDFSGAPELVLFCNGPWCGQSPRSIQNLVAAGYPPEKLHYFRGGMQSWQILGLRTYLPLEG